jgi:hypothetical protein
MQIPSYLQLNRFGIFHFRRAVPARLRRKIGKREITHSLHTRHPREAVQLGRLLAFQVEQLFREAEMGVDKFITADFIHELELPDGTVEKKEFTPQDIVAMKDAGLSPQQITDVLKSQAITINLSLQQRQRLGQPTPNRLHSKSSA